MEPARLDRVALWALLLVVHAASGVPCRPVWHAFASFSLCELVAESTGLKGVHDAARGVVRESTASGGDGASQGQEASRGRKARSTGREHTHEMA